MRLFSLLALSMKEKENKKWLLIIDFLLFIKFSECFSDLIFLLFFILIQSMKESKNKYATKRTEMLNIIHNNKYMKILNASFQVDTNYIIWKLKKMLDIVRTL